MGIFNRNFDKPGPGVNKDAPQKKGVQRFFEVLTRDFGDLVKLNLFFCACAIPSVAMFLLGLFGIVRGYAFILSIALAFPIGGALSASMFCVTNMLRNELGWIWHDFKRKFLENWKQAMIPGILCTAFIYMQIYLWVFLFINGKGISTIGLFFDGFALLIFGMAVSYLFLQIAYIDLNIAQIVKNSVLLLLMYAPRSFMGALTGGIIWIVFALFLPPSLFFTPILLLLGFSLSWLMSLMWTWPIVNKQYAIEETLLRKQSGEM